MRDFLEKLNIQKLRSYEADPGLLKEQYGIEEAVLAGGYGYRQILELVQNAADALLEATECDDFASGRGRILVQLRGSRLYVANTGAPLSEAGLDALLRSHSSPKRGNQIGRFGLGFKSLLKLNGRIDVLSRASGVVRFDPERCREELRRRFKVAEAPGLRLAWTLPPEECATDPNLDELAWAETVVRVEVGSEDLVQHIRQEIRSFPAEFLLFFPVAATLSLDDGSDEVRQVSSYVQDSEHVLEDGSTVTRWRIASRVVRISDTRAIADATHIHARESVPLTWAVPLDGRREESGRFWAFFPTHTATYLPGILNAPWKLNSDRNAIIAGEWNAALMFEAARLIADTLPGLATQDDPARPLDFFPRQMERKDEDAAPLVDSLWSMLKSIAVIPDANGAIRSFQDLWRHPTDTLSLAKTWQSLAGAEQKSKMVHPACLERQRASRLNALAERAVDADTGSIRPAIRRCDPRTWFSFLASLDADVAYGVLLLAEQLSLDAKSAEWSKIRPTLAIIPTQSGKLAAAEAVVLAPAGVSVPDREAIAVEIQAEPDVRRVLTQVLRVRELDDRFWVTLLSEAIRVSHWDDESIDAGWKAFWSKLRLAPAGVRENFLRDSRDSVRVRRRDGSWVRADRVLFPDGLVRDDGSPNTKVLVDAEFHGTDGESLALLGVSSEMSGDVGLANWLDVQGGAEVLRPWLVACRDRYKETHQNSALRTYLKPAPLSMPRGYALLAELTGAAKARFTLELLDRLAEPAFGTPVSFGHETRRSYPRIDVPHPLAWYIHEHGVVQMHAAIAPLRAAAARCGEPVLRRLPDWSPVEGALARLNATFPPVSVTPQDLRTFWAALVDVLATPQALDNDDLGGLWLGAAKDGFVPFDLASSAGRIPLTAVFVTTSADLARRARAPKRVVVVLDPVTMQLWLRSGAKDLSKLVQAEWASIAETQERLTDVLPELAEVMRAAARGSAPCQWVTQLRLRIADTVQATPCLLWEGGLLIDREQLAPLSRADRLRRLLNEIAACGWLDESPDVALQQLGDAGVDERRSYVAQGATMAERLLRAVGKRPGPLLSALGESLRDLDCIRGCMPEQLAELVLAQLGPVALVELKATLEEEGLQPPARWNSPAAVAFVASLGFPAEFASSAEARREAEELVSGPVELPPLHDFQEEVFQGLGSLLASGSKRRRAVVSLPTGGGKTRATVESAVRLVLAPENDRRGVLWIAQTDELCEQAVQAFRQVWINLGSRDTDLRIIRLWGGNPNPPRRDFGNPVVVVASIQTLNSRIGSTDLDWLREPKLVVVDECHHAITPSYSTLLRWLDLETLHSGAPEREEPVIVGLSATPFRTDDEESQRLAKRFENRWLPSNQEQLYSRLLAQGVLARARYESVESGVSLNGDELAKLGRLLERREGLEFENLLEAINQRLAHDERRNEKLVGFIRACGARSILFFSNSVAHSEEIAARLNLAGMAAAAISGGTPSTARRYFLDRFQSEQLRVICNHSVLTTGFDAPKTDLVLVARQVFSPVRYMQMVGRGLRGEKNGGTAECRIVTVIDNLGRFADRHPYHYCRQYFSDIQEPD